MILARQMAWLLVIGLATTPGQPLVRGAAAADSAARVKKAVPRKEAAEAAQIRLEPPRFTVPLLATAPHIDGRIDDAEWRGAAALTGFIDRGAREYGLRQGQVFLGYNRSHFFLAYRSSFPPGAQEGGAWDEKALRALVSERNGRVYSDDSVELYLAPQSPEKIIQLIGNSRGAILERHYAHDKWRGDWQFENRVDNAAGVWELELAISFESLGVKPPQPGDTWHFNLARNWKGLGETFHSLTGDYRGLLAEIQFSDQSPVVREESWGHLSAGQVEARLAIVNPSAAARPLSCSLAVEDRDGKLIAGTAREETVQPQAGQVSPFVARCRVAEKLPYALRVSVHEPGAKTPIYQRRIPFRVYDPVQVTPFYVLTTRKLGVLVDLSRVLRETADEALKAEVLVSAAGREVAGRRFDVRPESRETLYFSLPAEALQEELAIRCQVTGRAQGTIETVTQYRIPAPPAWLGKYVVPDDFVPSPWSALEIGDGPSVGCWNRRYVFGDTPFPERILVAGKDILAQPAKFQMESAAGPLVWDRVPLRVEYQSPAKVILSKSARTPDFTLTVRTTVEFDGYCSFDLSLDPHQAGEIRRMSLELPVRAEFAKFFHVDGQWGEKLFGPVARRSDYPALQDERHYYWLGNDDAGLCWLSDLASRDPTGGGTPRLGFRETEGGFTAFFEPLGGPQVVRDRLTCFLALQATPTRPPRHRPIRALMCYNTAPESLRYPVAKNADTVLEMSLEGVMNYPPPERDLEKIRDWIAGCHRQGMKFCIYQYIDSGTETEDYQKFWGDWVTRVPPDTKQWRTLTAKCCLNSSWSDYYASVLDTMIRDFDVDGIYMDGVMARECDRGDLHGDPCGDGRWPIRAAREHFKKVLYVARRNKGRESVLYGHVSLSTIAPVAGLMDVLLKGENYGAPLSYDDLTPDVMRAEFGRQWGPQTVILSQLTKKQLIPTGRFLGLAALHGVNCTPSFLPPADRTRLLYPLWQALDDFVVPGTDFLPYFTQRLFTEASGHPVSVYVNGQGDRFLVVVANQSDQPAALALTYHPEAHRRAGGIDSAAGTFSTQAVPCRQNRLCVELGGWDFELLDVRLQGSPPR
jgi:hypothetical protein